MRLIKTVFFLLLLAIIGAGAYAWSGHYDVGADAPHWRITEQAMEKLRERSIEERAFGLTPPDLMDAALIRGGAGNYDAMCKGCHLSPGLEETELSRGLYPQPPTWDALGRLDPRVAFWSIKHGIKASGMPAWGKSMEDTYLWGMVAFLQKLPELDAAQYQARVAESGGHSHGGGETHHDAPSTAAPAGPPETLPADEHEHDEGTPHEHAPAPEPEKDANTPDEHDH